MTLRELERRIRRLEQIVEQLRSERAKSEKWWIDQAGSFANDPVYQEIVRLGRKYRRSLRPKHKKGAS
jgi:hypothetical protein